LRDLNEKTLTTDEQEKLFKEAGLFGNLQSYWTIM
jgi:hypothetical protein